MKYTFLILLIMLLVSGKCSAQQVFNEDAFPRVSFNWVDSVKKYQKLRDFYYLTGDDDLGLRAYEQSKIYEGKLDSLADIKRLKKLKKVLKREYDIVLK